MADYIHQVGLLRKPTSQAFYGAAFRGYDKSWLWGNHSDVYLRLIQDPLMTAAKQKEKQQERKAQALERAKRKKELEAVERLGSLLAKIDVNEEIDANTIREMDKTMHEFQAVEMDNEDDWDDIDDDEDEDDGYDLTYYSACQEDLRAQDERATAESGRDSEYVNSLNKQIEPEIHCKASKDSPTLPSESTRESTCPQIRSDYSITQHLSTSHPSTQPSPPLPPPQSPRLPQCDRFVKLASIPSAFTTLSDLMPTMGSKPLSKLDKMVNTFTSFIHNHTAKGVNSAETKSDDVKSFINSGSFNLTESNLKAFDHITVDECAVFSDSDSDSDNESNDSGETASTITGTSFGSPKSCGKIIVNKTKSIFGTKSIPVTCSDGREQVFGTPKSPCAQVNFKSVKKSSKSANGASEIFFSLPHLLFAQHPKTLKELNFKETSDNTTTIEGSLDESKENKQAAVTDLHHVKNHGTFLAPMVETLWWGVNFGGVHPDTYRLISCDWELFDLNIEDLNLHVALHKGKQSARGPTPFIYVTAACGTQHFTITEPIVSQMGLDMMAISNRNIPESLLTDEQLFLLDHIDAREKGQARLKAKWEQWDLHGKRGVEFFEGRGERGDLAMETQLRKECRAADNARDWWTAEEEAERTITKSIHMRFGDQMREFGMF